MTRLRILFARFYALFAWRRLESELAEEIEAHLAMQIEENVRLGMTLQDARRPALREFGGVEQIKEIHREQRRVPFVDAVGLDLRFALRSFRRSPGLTVIAVLSLALGIGAGTAIFTLLDQVLLRTLPVNRPYELVRFDAPGPGFNMQRDTPHSLTYPFFRTLSNATSVFSGVLAEFSTDVNMTSGGGTEQVVCEIVSGSYFHVLGIAPAAGRLIAEADDLHPGSASRDCSQLRLLDTPLWRRPRSGRPPDRSQPDVDDNHRNCATRVPRHGLIPLRRCHSSVDDEAPDGPLVASDRQSRAELAACLRAPSSRCFIASGGRICQRNLSCRPGTDGATGPCVR